MYIIHKLWGFGFSAAGNPWSPPFQPSEVKYSWFALKFSSDDVSLLLKVPQLLLFNRSVIPNSLWPHLHHARLLCPSPSPGVCSNSCPLSRWCHPTISSSVVLFSSCLQSFLASGSFPMSWLFVSGGQSIGGSASSSVLLMNIQDLFPLGLTGLISKGDFKEFVYLWTGFSTTSLSKPLPALKRQWYNQGVRALWGPGFPVLHYFRVCSISGSLSPWCHPIISSSVVPFSSCLQSFLASGSFPMSQFFTSVAKILEFWLQPQSF